MMKIVITLALSCLAGVGWAQEQQVPAQSAQAEERLRALDEEAQALRAEWQAEQTRVREERAAEVERAKEEGRDAPAPLPYSSGPDYSDLVARLVDWADESEGEDAAAYLARAVRLGGLGADSEGRAAFERMLEQHAASPSWATLGPLIPGLRRSLGAEGQERALQVLAANPHPDVRGWVILVRHGAEVEKAPIDSERYREAKAALLAAHEAASDETLRQELTGPIDLRERLAVGVVSPDIEGVDLDGTAFKLSDYRGKVILLSFWGDW